MGKSSRGEIFITFMACHHCPDLNVAQRDEVEELSPSAEVGGAERKFWSSETLLSFGSCPGVSGSSPRLFVDKVSPSTLGLQGLSFLMLAVQCELHPHSTETLSNEVSYKTPKKEMNEVAGLHQKHRWGVSRAVCPHIPAGVHPWSQLARISIFQGQDLQSPGILRSPQGSESSRQNLFLCLFFFAFSLLILFTQILI